MKKINRIIPLLLVAIIALGLYTSCEKDKTIGTPVINYVRVCDPLAADSLLVAAGQGSYIAIMGQNLGSTVQLWFNNQRATLLATYISNTSIIVAVPSQIPTVVTNKMKLIFSNGDSLLYDFIVSINKPTITSMKCEYVADGGVATINGNYFYAPIKVYFPGVSSPAVIDSLGDQILKVTVPTGAQPGQITMVTNFGTTISDLWFRDNRNIFIDSDPFRGWWDASFVVSYPGTSDVPAINGNYIRVQKTFGDWPWLQVVGGDAGSMSPISKNIPDDAILHPELYNLKFEVNTIKPYNANKLLFAFGVSDGNQGDYAWKPPFDTQGEWETVVIPYETVTAAYSKQSVNANGYFARVVFHGTGTLVCDMSFDNFRIVPKVITN